MLPRVSARILASFFSLISIQIMGFLMTFSYRYGIFFVIFIPLSVLLLVPSLEVLTHTLSCYIFIKS